MESVRYFVFILFVNSVICAETQTEKSINSRISAQKCTEYQAPLFGDVSVVIGKKSLNYQERIEDCPFYLNSYNIPFKGEYAASHEFPHMAYIGYDNATKITWACGGTLISEKFVLTAAHCIRKKNLGPAKYVIFGALDVDIDETNDCRYDIIRSIIHPEFKSEVWHHAIALIEFNGPVKFSDCIRPACLPSTNGNSIESLVVTGIDNDTIFPLGNQRLRKVEFFVEAYDSCYDVRLNRKVDNETQFCAVSIFDRIGSCRIESGGPLIHFHPLLACMYEVVGISSGVVCGTLDPGVHTRVFPYLDWIESIVWPI